MKRGFPLLILFVISYALNLKAGDIPRSDLLVGENSSTLSLGKSDFEPYKNPTNIGREDVFKGHWSLFEMGANSFAGTNYSGYAISGFMDLDQNKSYEVNIRLLRYSLGLQKYSNNIGLVSGLGLNMNDYRFSNPYTIENEDGYTVPVSLDENGLSKTKLSTVFLTVPVLLEFQFPASQYKNRFFVSGGIIGGLKIGSHTKVKQDNVIKKNHDDFNINQFRYGATVRIGYRDLSLFGTYYFTALFKQNRGPEMYPFTIGIGLISW
jgi:hypothetical protein